MKLNEFMECILFYEDKKKNYVKVMSALDEDSALALNIACIWMGTVLGLCRKNLSNDRFVQDVLFDMEELCKMCDKIANREADAPSLQIMLLLFDRLDSKS